MAMLLNRDWLGTFVYDDTLFTRTSEGLKYIGLETDGKYIQIPKGIKNCSYMFRNSNLVNMPKIPDGVKETIGMFSGCSALITTTKIPDSVINASQMFAGCISIKDYVFPLPKKLMKASYMFHGCKRLTEVYPILPEHLTDAQFMFTDCIALKTYIKHLPELVENVEDMFASCNSLEFGIMHQSDFVYRQVYSNSSMYISCNGLKPMPYSKINTSKQIKINLNLYCTHIIANSIASLNSIMPNNTLEHYFNKCLNDN